ncbi:hypothetical protein BDV93DRAFT_192893 [Ceratobasidium sp. AG-I]|nr:hypothetical protein BDV93DRAFT_192893 [Ceratobasidium sp. AG-I]
MRLLVIGCPLRHPLLYQDRPPDLHIIIYNNNRDFRGLRISAPETPSSIGGLASASFNKPPRDPPADNSFRAMPFLNRDLGITARGATTFDYLDNAFRIAPRIVVKMDWYSERADSGHEYIMIRVSERVYHKDVWIRFLPYSEDNIGDYAYTEADIMPENADLRASLIFENGVHYLDILETRREVRKSPQDRNSEVRPPLTA